MIACFAVLESLRMPGSSGERRPAQDDDMHVHLPPSDFFQYRTSDHCPRCSGPLLADRTEARLCKACSYGRPGPPAHSKKIAIYGWGSFELLHPRFDWLLQNVVIGRIITAPRMALPERYALYREVNFHEYSGGPRMMLKPTEVDFVICVGPSEYFDHVRTCSVPFRYLNGRTGQASSSRPSVAKGSL